MTECMGTLVACVGLVQPLHLWRWLTTYSRYQKLTSPADHRYVVWMANRNNPLRENATLTFSDDGMLTLRNSDGTLVWHTNATTDKLVARLMILNNEGNLCLSDEKHEFVSWQSFNHPTDTILLWQMLIESDNRTIVASASQQDA
ncbi:G-type lectin S-receptor-like serine/threonine-protein kinase SD2-5 [Acorus calamus]|uniref:G-type lectin S-receptor-like serine/threonine-protein kinase SD2-5 n=1 Tax=Acorus calamus TaxID=4465 RepID=A0AAV9FLG2_ACOCL|nr:G-type lectin S-receptor-like serine/threonine-protein kinase SD2-5 [Acorus calamus]